MESLVECPARDEGWSRLVGGFTAVPDLVRSLGADPASIHALATLGPDALGSPGRRISHVACMRLLAEAARATSCPHFGVVAGSAWRLSDLGVTGELMRHSPTVGQALREFVAYQHLNSDGAIAYLLHRGTSADLGYAVYDPLARDTSCLYDAAMAAGVAFLRELCGGAWNPTEVRFPRAAPADATPYHDYFRAPLRFDSGFCAIRFGTEVFVQPVPGADPARLRLARAEAAAVGRPPFVQTVYRAVRTLLLEGKRSGADVAASLAMHRRTLNRRLSAEGTTFQQVLDAVRLTVAKELLEQSAHSLDDVASALGYTGPATLVRAFRRWTGTTPGVWREASRNGSGRRVGKCEPASRPGGDLDPLPAWPQGCREDAAHAPRVHR